MRTYLREIPFEITPKFTIDLGYPVKESNFIPTNKNSPNYGKMIWPKGKKSKNRKKRK